MNSNGLYGTVRPAVLNPEDAEIFYYYRPTRGVESDDFVEGFKQLEASECLVPATVESVGRLNGMFNLRLPLDKFNMKGYYTVYIRPKEIDAVIENVSTLVANPTVKGVIFNTENLQGIEDLTGYRIEYEDDEGNVTMARLITSCNYCEPQKVVISDSYTSVIRYSLTNNSSQYSIVFCTVTPSSVSASRPNSIPSIGRKGQKVRLVNTKFDPVMLEIEMVEHDIETLTTMIEGDQIRDLDNGLITTYNDNKEIYRQHEYYTLKSENGTPLYDVKIKRDIIDPTQDYNSIVGQ